MANHHWSLQQSSVQPKLISATMLDHGLVASHASHAAKPAHFVFVQIQSDSGSATYHDHASGLTPPTIETWCQTSESVANKAIHRPRSSHKAWGSQTVSWPPAVSPLRPCTAHASLSCIPSRTSSLSQKPSKQMSPSARRCKTVALRHRNDKQFSSIDEMLASSSDSDQDPVTGDPTSRPPPGRSSSHFNSLPSRKRPSLSHSAMYASPPSQTKEPQLPQQSPPPAGPVVPLRTSSSLPLLNSKAPSIKQPAHVHTFPTSTLDFAHHPSPSPPQSLHAKRPSLHQPHTFSWTSDATRRREYAKIDRAHSGLRGFCRRVLPVCFRNGRRNFWDAEKHGDDNDDDADSVRRYRLRLPDTPRLATADEKSPLVASSGRKLSCF